MNGFFLIQILYFINWMFMLHYISNILKWFCNDDILDHDNEWLYIRSHIMPLILSIFFQQMNLNWDWFKLTLNDKYLRTYWGLIMASTILSDYVLCWRFDTKKIKNYEAWKLTLFYNPTWWHHKKKVTAHMYFFIHLQIGLTTKFVKNQFSYTLQ